MFLNFYRNKKILITGHTGFKGSWLTLWLNKLGANVIGYALNPPTNPNLYDSLYLKKKIKHIIGDVRDKDHLEKVITYYKPDLIFHLAAQTIVKESYIDPQNTFETNIMGTVNLFEAARKTLEVKAIVNVTSDKCYENKEWLYKYRENDALGGYDPYSSSKACSEFITASYRKSFFTTTGIATARAGNVIGGGDWGKDRLIPDCIQSLIKSKNIELRSPKSVRPWQFVLEPLAGYLWLGVLLYQKPLKYSRGWNFGPEDEDRITVKDLACEMIKIWGSGKIKISRGKFLESQLLRLDVSLAKSELKWYSIYKINEAVSRTVNWYKEYYFSKSASMWDFSMAEIEQYENFARSKKIIWSKK